MTAKEPTADDLENVSGDSSKIIEAEDGGEILTDGGEQPVSVLAAQAKTVGEAVIRTEESYIGAVQLRVSNKDGLNFSQIDLTRSDAKQLIEELSEYVESDGE